MPWEDPHWNAPTNAHPGARLFPAAVDRRTPAAATQAWTIGMDLKAVACLPLCWLVVSCAAEKEGGLSSKSPKVNPSCLPASRTPERTASLTNRTPPLFLLCLLSFSCPLPVRAPRRRPRPTAAAVAAAAALILLRFNGRRRRPRVRSRPSQSAPAAQAQRRVDRRALPRRPPPPPRHPPPSPRWSSVRRLRAGVQL
jgi:hypothetical protein